MSKIYGGAAFPHDRDCGQWCEGMTLRQWYAGQALAGLCASHAHPDAMGYPDGNETALKALSLADAMIEHERKENEPTRDKA